MPHFIIDCSENIIQQEQPDEIITKVHDIAESTGLFSKGDIKVRIRPYKHYTVGGTQKDFIHVFGYIMEGRTIIQKKELSEKIIKCLKKIFHEVPVISININDFEKSTYCNKSMV